MWFTKTAIGCNGDPNAVFTECLSSCEPTCDNPYPEACTADCKGAGCMCKQGYVLNKENGKCVQLEDCPGNSFFNILNINLGCLLF